MNTLLHAIPPKMMGTVSIFMSSGPMTQALYALEPGVFHSCWLASVSATLSARVWCSIIDIVDQGWRAGLRLSEHFFPGSLDKSESDTFNRVEE
jgi:hypothetical protein